MTVARQLVSTVGITLSVCEKSIWERDKVYDIVNLIRAIGGKVTSVSECYDRSYVTAEIPVEYKDCFKTFD